MSFTACLAKESGLCGLLETGLNSSGEEAPSRRDGGVGHSVAGLFTFDRRGALVGFGRCPTGSGSPVLIGLGEKCFEDAKYCYCGVRHHQMHSVFMGIYYLFAN